MSDISCEKEKNYDFEAMVIYNEDNSLLSCQPPILFLKITKGLEGVVDIIGKSHSKNDSVFSVVNVPTDLWKDSLIIKLNLRKVNAEEVSNCSISGIPVVMPRTILFAKDAEKVGD